MGEISERGPYPPAGFTRDEYDISGVKTVVYSAGEGPPVVYFHGGGTFHGIDFACPWIDRFKVILPFHPGFGESGDAPRYDSLNDYLLHYLDLFDVLGLEQFDLVGISFGGWLAAEFATAHPHRVRKLVLAAPAGLIDPDHPPLDLSALPPDEVLASLVADFEVLQPYLPKSAEEAAAFGADREREGASLTRIAANGPFNPKLGHWLHRATMPVLLLWGREDKILPVGMSAQWTSLLPDVKLELFDGVGHLVFDESARARELTKEFLDS